MGIILFSGCSVTKHLPEGEVLYTGGKTVIQNKSTTPVGGTALTEIEAALDKTPSTKMLGGLLPIPFKMWMYNDFVKYKKGFGKWMFNRLAANPPVFISTVNPEVRIKVATNLLRDYGYFNGKVTYETLVDKKPESKYSLYGRHEESLFYRYGLLSAFHSPNVAHYGTGTSNVLYKSRRAVQRGRSG